MSKTGDVVIHMMNGDSKAEAIRKVQEERNAAFTTRRTTALNALREELARLPAFNAFGGSNARDKAEMRRWIAQLEIVAYNVDAYSDPDVVAYLKGEWSPITDSI